MYILQICSQNPCMYFNMSDPSSNMKLLLMKQADVWDLFRFVFKLDLISPVALGLSTGLLETTIGNAYEGACLISVSVAITISKTRSGIYVTCSPLTVVLG